jgi:hypothetical protein
MGRKITSCSIRHIAFLLKWEYVQIVYCIRNVAFFLFQEHIYQKWKLSVSRRFRSCLLQLTNNVGTPLLFAALNALNSTELSTHYTHQPGLNKNRSAEPTNPFPSKFFLLCWKANIHGTSAFIELYFCVKLSLVQIYIIQKLSDKTPESRAVSSMYVTAKSLNICF